jgi:hypothetical protein
MKSPDESPSRMSVPAVASAADPSPDSPGADADNRGLHVVTDTSPAPRSAPDEPHDGPDGASPRLHAVADAPVPPRAARPAVSDLPDAALAAERLARCVLEILAGARDLDQVSRWVNGEVFAGLQKRVRIAARAREANGVRSQRPVFRIGGVHVSEPAPGVAEAVVVVHGRARTRSVAIRLETTGRRWRATALHVI